MALDFNITLGNSSLVPYEYHKDQLDADVDVCIFPDEYHKDLTQNSSVVILMIVLYMVITVMALLGNLLVIWIVWINSHMHTVTNYYIVNLAVSDLLVAVLVVPLKLLEYTAPCRWHIFRSDGLCSVVYYLLPVFVFASVLTLAAISIERYYAIVHPLSAMTVNSKSRTKKIIAVTWILPFIVAGPYIFSKSYAFTIHSELGSISREICNDRFNEIDIAIHGDSARVGEFRKGYFLALFWVIYVVPSAMILITCIKIAVSLLKPILPESAAIARTETNRRQEENKRKVAKMVVVISLTFIASWTPLYLVSIVSQLQQDSFLKKSNFIFTMLITHFCGFVNSCLNPIIYTAMSQKFRRSFKDIFKRVWYCCTCNASGKSRLRYGVSHRFTSTLHRTLTETDAHHIALQEHVKYNGSFRSPKSDAKSTSSGTNPELRQLKTNEIVIVNKNIVKDSRPDSQCGDDIDHSCEDKHEFKPQRKGIMKIKADLTQATSRVCKDYPFVAKP